MSPPDRHRLARDAGFLLYLANRTGHVMGVQILTVAVGWYVYQLTGDPIDLGYVGLAQFAPAFLFVLAAGMAADRLDRRMILALCNAIHVAVTGLLVVVLWAGAGGVAAILAILFVHGIARAFAQTAVQALLPNLVPVETFPRAVAWSSSANKVAQLAGPALGGGLIAWTGDGVYGAAAACFAIAAGSALLIPPVPGVRSAGRVTLDALLGGFSYVWREKRVLGAISIDLLAVLLGGVMGLLPVYASDILHVGPDGLGVMRAMPGFGSLLVGLVLARLASPRHMGPALFVSLALFAAAIVVFSLSTLFWLSLVALAVYGAADMVSVYIRLTLVQLATPDDMRGRVSAVNSVAINASNELGDFRAGVTAAFVGVVPAVLAGGVATFAVAGLWAWLFPAIRRVDRLSDVAPGRT